MAQRSARRRSPRPGPQPHVVGSWIWLVLTPQIEHCQYERAILGTSLTFRGHSRRFERLLPLRDALTPDGRHVFEDMLGERPEYDAVVAAHDEALASLLGAAIALHAAIVALSEFASVFDEVVGEVRATNERDVPTPDARPSWLGYVAADVVNDIAADLDSTTSEWAIWNRGATRFKALAPARETEALVERRRRFAATVDDAQKRLFAVRKDLSRKYDLPVVPVPGANVEGPLD